MEKNNLTTHYVNHPFKVTKPLSKHLKPRGNAEVSDVSSTLGQVEEPKAFVMFSSFPKSHKFDVVTEKKEEKKILRLVFLLCSAQQKAASNSH